MAIHDSATASTQGDGPARDASVPRPGLLRVRDSAGALVYELHAVESEFTLGRDPENRLCIEDPALSRRHASITLRPRGLSVTDLGSRHGTWVNGARIEAETELAHGDVLVVGDSVFLAVTDVDAAQPTSFRPIRSESVSIGSTWVRRVEALAARLGPMDIHLLVWGEPGVGKEAIIDRIHGESKRIGPILSANCGAIPKDIAEAYFFGVGRGGAPSSEAKEGLFTTAREGTVVLDEVGELSPGLQAKLLRAVETGEYFPVGASEPIKLTTRIVASSSRDLRKGISEGTFRADLFHRLAGVEVWVPPLRDRPEEIALIARQVVDSYNSSTLISRDAIVALLRYRYPANVSELRRIVRTAHVSAAAAGRATIGESDLSFVPEAESSILLADIPPKVQRTTAPSLNEVKAALVRHHGNVSHAAQMLGVHRAQIYRVLQDHTLSAESFRDD